MSIDRKVNVIRRVDPAQHQRITLFSPDPANCHDHTVWLLADKGHHQELSRAAAGGAHSPRLLLPPLLSGGLCVNEALKDTGHPDHPP